MTNAKYYDYKYRLNKVQTESQPLPPGAESYGSRRQCGQWQPPATSAMPPYSRSGSSQKSYDIVCCECPIHGTVQYARESKPRSNSYDRSWEKQAPVESYATRTYYRPTQQAKPTYASSPISNSYRCNSSSGYDSLKDTYIDPSETYTADGRCIIMYKVIRIE